MEDSRLKFIKFVDARRIHVLMASIFLLVFIPPFFSDFSNFNEAFIKVDFLIIVIISYLIIRKIKTSRYVGYVTLLLIVADAFLDMSVLNYLAQIGISYLIIHAFILVLKEAISLKGDTKNLILVSITGYMIIGLIGGFLAAGLEYIFPDSFYHTTGMALELYNFIYYSYVTMTTLGYGDIIPVSEKSQALALMLVISGQLFLSVIIGINIAKFIQKKMK
ncbi:ion channel [Lutimonas vermicola]|uniref:Ion channel n=1 Tax=Lutimonas vermicola TaxID=414288 RepID=A0ABU9KXT5_9FLAO